MSPALIRLHNVKPDELAASFFTHDTDTMHVQSTLYPRSSDSGNIGGMQQNTVIFIIVGVVCLFVILAGFYLVSRSHVASNSASGITITHPPCPRDNHNTTSYPKIWKKWRHTSRTHPPAVVAAEAPTVQIYPPAETPSPTIPPTVLAYPSVIPRPSQNRRVTSLSVTTSFSHSHITQEALNDFRVSAYDLDGDLETEMLNSARDDAWSGHMLAIEGEAGIEETLEGCGGVIHVVDGSGHSSKESDHENLEVCQDMEPGGNGEKGVVVELVEVSDAAMTIKVL